MLDLTEKIKCYLALTVLSRKGNNRGVSHHMESHVGPVHSGYSEDEEITSDWFRASWMVCEELNASKGKYCSVELDNGVSVKEGI